MSRKIEELGEFGFIRTITRDFKNIHPETLKGVGDDAAVIDIGNRLALLSSELFLEGIHFDLTYTPIVHLGYKIVVAAISDILAMNGVPKQITVSLGLSSRFDTEQVQELYKGIRFACSEYELDLVGGDTSASLTGLTLGVTALGQVDKEKIVYRSGARTNDLVCVTGDLGAAYMGLKLLDREKRVLEGNHTQQPQFGEYKYLLQRQLKPEARTDVIRALAEVEIVPSAMIDLSDGLASDMLQLCEASECGVRIYLNRIPIAKETFTLSEEMRFDPVVAALNGGDDYELLFTVPVGKAEALKNLPGTEIIGHITDPATGAALTTPDGQDIPLQAPGWTNNGMSDAGK